MSGEVPDADAVDTGAVDAGEVDPGAVDAVLTASRALIAVATKSLGAAAEETTIAQYRALVVLACRGPQRLVDLSSALGVAPSTAGRMRDRLVRKGLIRRHRARSDRRAVLVSIMAPGRRGDPGQRLARGAVRRARRAARDRPSCRSGHVTAAGQRGSHRPAAATARLFRTDPW